MSEQVSPALADALRRLKNVERTEAELRKALAGKHDADEVDAAIAWLSARKLLSESRAVEATVRPRSSGKRAEGDQKLRERLERRGVASEAVEAALADAPSEADRMHDALAAKFRPEDGQRAKAGRFLLSRGFEEEAVESALDRFFGDG
jgi:SOS response regulatory protein OraA/RecX